MNDGKTPDKKTPGGKVTECAEHEKNREILKRKAEQIEKLVHGCSMQAGVSNRYWLALIAVSITVFTIYGNPCQTDQVTLPFNLGNVNADWFYVICTVILSGITIAYVTAHLQVTMLKDNLRAMCRQLAELEKRHPIPAEEIDSPVAGEMITSCIAPNTNKVSTIPDHLFSEYRKDRNYRWPVPRVILYALLKLVSALFSYGVPIFALWLCAKGLTKEVGMWIVPLYLIAAVAGFAMLVQVRSDFLWTRRAIVGWCRRYKKYSIRRKLNKR